jgi:hypothetical protein
MTGTRFMSVYQLAGKSNNLLDFELPVSGLYLLAAPSTPEDVRDDVPPILTKIRITERPKLLARSNEPRQPFFGALGAACALRIGRGLGWF